MTTTGEAPGTNRLEVAGEHGKIVISADEPGLVFTRNECSSIKFSKEATSGFAMPGVWNVAIAGAGDNEQHVGIMKNFVAAIRGEAPLIAPATEGVHSVELANAMLLSSFRDHPITLPIDAEDYAAELKKKITESTFTKKTVAETGVASDFAKSF